MMCAYEPLCLLFSYLTSWVGASSQWGLGDPILDKALAAYGSFWSNLREEMFLEMELESLEWPLGGLLELGPWQVP